MYVQVISNCFEKHVVETVLRRMDIEEKDVDDILDVIQNPEVYPLYHDLPDSDYPYPLYHDDLLDSDSDSE